MTSWEADPGAGLYEAGYREGYRRAWLHCVTAVCVASICLLTLAGCLTMS